MSMKEANPTSLDQHNKEIHQNQKHWNRKPLLKKIYAHFYDLISREIQHEHQGHIVELGSGIGNLKMKVPECICTDLFPNPWLDQTENAYHLSFEDATVSNLILFDVFHHLEYPGTAFTEFRRVLAPGGRVIIFDPYISMLGKLIYGRFHHEPIGKKEDINWCAPASFDPVNADYYAAQGNATHIFFKAPFKQKLEHHWQIINRNRYASISYVASGGYAGPQLYPDSALGAMKVADRIFNILPKLFATRVLVVLEKK